MSEQALSLKEQEKLVAEIVRMAKQLEGNGDPFLFGQYMHLRERAECLASILEFEGAAAAR